MSIWYFIMWILTSVHFVFSTMSDMKDANAVGNSEPMDQSGDHSMPSAQQQEQVIKKKFGGLIPKKPPLISKDHERAYFDSADWALGKSGQQGVSKPKGPLEALRPKLQPTRQHQQRSRSSIYTASENEDGDGAGSEDMNISWSTACSCLWVPELVKQLASVICVPWGRDLLAPVTSIDKKIGVVISSTVGT